MRATAKLLFFCVLFFSAQGLSMTHMALSGKALAQDSAMPQPALSDPNITDIYDIKPLAPYPGYPEYVKWLAVLGVAALVLLMSYLGYRYYQKKRAGLPDPPPPPADETALKALSRMRELLEGEGKVFYFRLSFVFREYIYHRYSINAPEMTDEELIPRLNALGLESELMQKTREFFSYSGPVKFADEIASRSKMEEHYKFVRYFVKNTTPVDSEPKPESESQSQSQPESKQSISKPANGIAAERRDV